VTLSYRLSVDVMIPKDCCRQDRHHSSRSWDWCYTMTAPTATIPVIQADSAEARNTAAWATSAGVPRRRNGWTPTSCRRMSGAGPHGHVLGQQFDPGPDLARAVRTQAKRALAVLERRGAKILPRPAGLPRVG
jgi:hypothetical protein